MVGHDWIGSGDVDGRPYTKRAHVQNSTLVNRGRALTCREILRHPLKWWRIILFAFLVFGPIWYSLIDREPPYTFLAGRVLPPLPEPGGQLDVMWEVQINRTSCRLANSRSVTRRIVDSRGTIWDFANLPIAMSKQPLVEGQTKLIVRSLDLPWSIARGPATYRSTACFVCDPFGLQEAWPICVSTPDLKFNVKGDPDEPPPHVMLVR